MSGLILSRMGNVILCFVTGIENEAKAYLLCVF